MKRFILLLVLIATTNSCGIYSFTGVKLDENLKTFQVNFFRNQAAQVIPGIDLKFTQDFQDYLQNQTDLSQTTNGGDIVYEGEIERYFIAPMTATANNQAAQNRLTIDINVRFYNKLTPADDFEKRFSFYFDYGRNEQLVGTVLDGALEVIYERIIQDIFNDSLGKW